MSVTDWAVVVPAAVALVLLVVLFRERGLLRQRLHNAEGVISGLSLDLEATRAKVSELQAYLAQPGNWSATSSTTVPHDLADPAPADRWTPTSRRSGARNAAVHPAAGSDQPVPKQAPQPRD